MFSNFSSTPLIEPDPSPPAGVLGTLPGAGVAVAKGSFAWVTALDRKTKAVVAAGAALGLALAFVWVGRASRGELKAKVAVEAPAPVASAPPVLAPPTPPVPPPPPVVAKAAEADTTGDEGKEAAPDENGTEAKPDGDSDTTAKAKTAARNSSGAAGGGENKRMLAEGERMLRAERFAEARGIFEKLTKAKRERGQALVGLAEISFQEKKYADAARTAELAAERGGGVKARVLLGDAHFRLARYKEAAKAYEDALKLDPGNASAKSGLSLANKRM